MAKASGKVTRCAVGSIESIDIPDDILQALEKLPEPRAKTYPPWHDEVIKRYYGKKSVHALSKLLQRSTPSVVARAKLLRVRGIDIQRYGNDSFDKK